MAALRGREGSFASAEKYMAHDILLENGGSLDVVETAISWRWCC